MFMLLANVLFTKANFRLPGHIVCHFVLVSAAGAPVQQSPADNFVHSSLRTLNEVILALSADQQYIPYSKSLLTRLLQVCSNSTFFPLYSLLSFLSYIRVYSIYSISLPFLLCGVWSHHVFSSFSGFTRG